MGQRCPAKVAAITHRCGSSAGSPGNREAPCHSLAGNSHLITWCRGGVRIQKKGGGVVHVAHPGLFCVLTCLCAPGLPENIRENPPGLWGWYRWWLLACVLLLAPAQLCKPELARKWVCSWSLSSQFRKGNHAGERVECSWEVPGEERKSAMRKNTCCVI